MTQQIINVGLAANDNTGDTLRNAFIKTNDNFTEIYTTQIESLRANVNLTGGGTITFNSSEYLFWNTRFIVISNGRGSHFATQGYFNIDCPTSGTITGVGGANSVTATAAGIPLGIWQALYYILPIGQGAGSVPANFRIADYAADIVIPDTWVLIALRNGDSGQGVYLPRGHRLKVGESIDTITYDAKNADLLDGQQGSYYLDWTNITNKPDPQITVSLSGDVTGSASATLTDLGNGTVSITTTVGDNSHNHTSLTGITSIGFSAQETDSASISTTISGTQTFFDFNLTDDNNNDLWRWRFTPSGSSTYDAMKLEPVSNGVANLTVAGSVVATSSTISNNLTLSGGTANGVLYLNGSKVATSGSALTFDGSVLTLAPNQVTFGSSTIIALGSGTYFKAASTNGFLVNNSADTLNFFKIDTSGNAIFYPGGTEGMRLTSTGLGIGTSSPSDILTLAGGASGSYGLTINNAKVGGGTKAIFQYDATNQIALVGGNTTNGLAFQTLTGGSLTTKATLDSSGNLGIGTSSPSRKLDVQGAPFSIGGNGTGVLANFVNNTTAFNASPTVAISLWNRFNSGGSTFPSAVVQAGKENATDGDYAGYLSLQTTDAGGTSTERMRLDSSGNLGIGTSSPVTKIHVNGTGNTGVTVQDSGGVSFVDFVTGAGTNRIISGFGGTANLGFYTASTLRATLDSSGNLGIGTSSPGAKLDVSGADGVRARVLATSGGTPGLILSSAGNTAYTIKAGNADNSLRIDQDGSDRITLASGGNLGIGTSSPAYKLDVNGTFRSTGNGTVEQLLVVNAGSGVQSSLRLGQAGVVNWDLRNTATTGVLDITNGAGSALKAESPSAGVVGLYVKADGSVGIGTSSPGVKLDVAGVIRASSGVFAGYFPGFDQTYINSNGATGNGCVMATVNYANTAYQPISYDASVYLWRPNGTEQMRLDSSGNLGIGTSTPSSYGKLTVWGGNVYVQSTTAGVGSKITLSDTNNLVSVESSPVGAASDMIFRTSATTRMTLDASGNLLVGGTTQLYGAAGRGLIQVSGSSSALLGFGTTGNTGLGYINHTGTAMEIVNAQNSYLSFATNASERARITSGGDLLVGTTTGNGRISVLAPASGASSYALLDTSNTGTAYAELKSTGTTYGYIGSGAALVSTGAATQLALRSESSLLFSTGITERARITSGGDFGIGTTTPQYRLDVNNSGSGFQASFGSNFSAGSWSGIHFGYSEAANTNYRKSAIVFERQDSSARGKIHILNNGEENATSATLTHSRVTVQHDGNVGVGTTSPVYKLEVNGSFAATTKSFVINHPTKPGKKLRYGSLEGPENGVYVRGRLKGTNVIELPDYWTKLVDPESITVNLTPIGKHQNLYVEEIIDNKVIIRNGNLLNKEISCYYTVFAERIDVEKLEVEIG